MKNFLRILLALALVATASAQVQNVQVASGANPDVTKPATGFNLPSGFTLNVKTGATISGAGTYDFTSGILVVPNGASPVTTSFGQLAAKNNAWASGRGAPQFYDGTANTYLVNVLASSTPTNGQVPTWNTGGTITWNSVSVSTANPSASIGLTAVNGAASTVMRSDAAPALDQTIAPTWTGVHTFSPTARTSGSSPYLAVTLPSDTSLTAGVEAFGVSFVGATRQHASNTSITNQREYVFGVPTYSFASATGTITNAATVYISGNPAAGTNAVITNPFALWVGGGNIGLGGPGFIASIGTTASTGNLALASANNANITLVPNGTGQTITDTGSHGGGAPVATGIIGTYAGTDALGSIFIRRASADNGANILRFAKARGTIASPAVIQSGDTIGSIFYGGYDGTNWSEHAGDINAITTEQWSGSARGMKLTFSTITTATTTRNTALLLENNGAVLAATPGAGLGYATGLTVGGAVTQITSRTTGVTLNNVTGAITLVSAAGSATPATFTVTDSAVAATDVVVVSQKSGTDLYEIFVTNVAAGSFKITSFTTGGTTTEQPVFNFAVIKGSAN